ncbi:GGDEF domain-containing protein [uncultured Shewanella sp.]|uniref:GGDEF domain-containing protein n=1 Tax=Shewanella atlantica TaxID=271099 RepID=UPI00261C1016|nr:GGDEF domain-containing protein [uncultured Shewanella sp.]
MNIFAIFLVLSGLTGLCASLFPTHQMCNIPDHQHKGWLLLLNLIFMFILGYLGYIWMLINREIGTLEMIVATIFCGGGMFVFIITKMSRETILTLQQTIKAKHYQAHHDQLTGLPNRSLFYEELDRLIAISDQKFCCLMMDLNDFKMVNDTFGHAEGDHVLQIVAQRINKIIPTGALAARLGGDELTVVLPHAQDSDALTVAKTIQQELLKDISCGKHSLIIGVSIGIAEYPRDGDNRKSLMKSADIAMYHAKKNEDNLQIFTPHMG